MKQFVKDLSKREMSFIAVIIIGLLAVGLYVWQIQSGSKDDLQTIDTFQECAAAGNPIMESYPERCSANGQTFTNPNQSLN